MYNHFDTKNTASYGRLVIAHSVVSIALCTTMAIFSLILSNSENDRDWQWSLQHINDPLSTIKIIWRKRYKNCQIVIITVKVKSNLSRSTRGCIWLTVSDTGKWTSFADVSTSLDTSCWANTQTTSTIKHGFSCVSLTNCVIHIY